MSGGDVNYICIKSCASLVFFSIDTELSEHVDAVFFFPEKPSHSILSFCSLTFQVQLLRFFKFNSISFAK